MKLLDPCRRFATQLVFCHASWDSRPRLLHCTASRFAAGVCNFRRWHGNAPLPPPLPYPPFLPLFLKFNVRRDDSDYGSFPKEPF